MLPVLAQVRIYLSKVEEFTTRIRSHGLKYKILSHNDI